MTPDEQVAAVKAVMAEGGYPDAEVYWHTEGDGSTMWPAPPEGSSGSYVSMRWGVRPSDGLLAAFWRATRLVLPPRPLWRCWPCYQAGEPVCEHDWRTAEWPPVPERTA